MDSFIGKETLHATTRVPWGRGFTTGRWRPVVTWATLTALGGLVLCVCSSTASAIIMGSSLTSDQYDGVGMIPPTTNHGLGTGTMVSPFVFLTAGQNLLESHPSPYEFTLGPGMTAHATEIRLDPNFATPDGLNLAFDLALIKLDEADVRNWPSFTRYAISDVLPPLGSLVTGVGFGDNEPGSGSGVKRSGFFSVNKYVGGEDDLGGDIPRAFIEATSGTVVPQWIAFGDVGGPLFFDNQIVGVASYRFGIEDEAGPSYYVSPLNDADWIRETLNELDPPVPEPGTLTIMVSGLIGLAVARLRRHVPTGRLVFAVAVLTGVACALQPEPAAAGLFYARVHVRAFAEASQGPANDTPLQAHDDHDSGFLNGTTSASMTASASVGNEFGGGSGSISITAALGHVFGSATATALAGGPFPNGDVRNLYVGGDSFADSLDVSWGDTIKIGGALGEPVDFIERVHLESKVTGFGSSVVGGTNGFVRANVHLQNSTLSVFDRLTGADVLDASQVFHLHGGDTISVDGTAAFLAATGAYTDVRTGATTAVAEHSIFFHFDPITPGATYTTDSGVSYLTSAAEPSPIPEPGALTIMVSGLIGLAVARLRRHVPTARLRPGPETTHLEKRLAK
jgi:hypothetical protein